MIVVWLVVAPADARAAPCSTSSPSTQSFPETVGDDEGGLAPDIVGTVASLDSACRLTIGYALREESLIEGDRLSFYLNSDGNMGTGEPTFEGAEYFVLIIGRNGPDEPPILSVWNAAKNDFDYAVRTLEPAGNGFRINLNDVSTSSGTSMGLVGAASWRGNFETYYDWAPNITASGQDPYRFASAFAGPSAPPPPPPPPPPPTPPPPTTFMPTPSSGSSPVRPTTLARITSLTIRGTAVRVRLNMPHSATLELRLRKGSTTVGRSTRTVGTGSRLLIVRLGSKALRRYRKRRSIALRLAVRIIPAGPPAYSLPYSLSRAVRVRIPQRRRARRAIAVTGFLADLRAAAAATASAEDARKAGKATR